MPLCPNGKVVGNHVFEKPKLPALAPIACFVAGGCRTNAAAENVTLATTVAPLRRALVFETQFQLGW